MEKKAKFAKIMLCPFNSDSRTKRECKLLEDLNVDITVFDTSTCDNIHLPKYSFVSSPDAFNGSNIFNRSLKYIKWANRVSKGNFDIISAYDISALLIAWLSNLFKKHSNKAKLIYDSHEFEYGRNTDRKSWISKLVLKVECFLIKKCAFSIMVNGTIAEEIQKLHHLESRPIVVRNVPISMNIDSEMVIKRRKELIEMFPIDSQISTILMYHGGVMPGRGIEQIIDILDSFENTVFVVMGNTDEKYLDYLKAYSIAKGVEDNVRMHPSVPIDVLCEYVGATDIGMVNIQNVSISYYYCLPNKLFENIHAGTPVIASNFPELSNIVNGYEIGITFDVNNNNELIDAVKKLQNDKKTYLRFRENEIIAKKELCWEKEKLSLIEAYQSIL